MTTLQLVIICVTGIVLTALVVRSGRQEASSKTTLTLGGEGTKVVLHTAQGDITGTITRVALGHIGLRDAAVLGGGEQHPLGGQVVVPYAEVVWAQVL